jgi:ABC-type transport system involved in multi-copper enzyme maturation permease subunit
VALLIPALVAALSVLMLKSKAKGHLEDVAAGEIFSHSLVTAFEGVAVGIRDALPVAALILAGLASQSLAGEMTRGTLRNLLLRPVGRVGLALGKLLGMLTVAALAYLLVVTAAVVTSTLLFDFTDVVEILETDDADPWVITEAKALWPPFRAMLAGMLPPLLAYTGLGFLLGAFAKRGVTALALAAGSVVFLDVLRVAGRAFGFEGLLLSCYSPSPLGDTSRVAHLLDLIRAPNSPPSGMLEGALLVPAVWLVLAAALSVLLLSRRSVP